ncbi:molybdopterin-guanine dinucleotide biosynthesis protein MobA [Dechloromonas denitrificans]|uniref:Molybdopterin-guanine dinucleotide biosynthesis protein MobA n=1 Tax=Dechloromonas denitrificans TaxID=281362 RepID=A0A133XJQ3_9RHOO|nr:nucleotidyltransferase family protein [Dechloromonas denitrificans]KXB31172.1 molybdopterin-guanine dinucleotide biosynthesis protein MobA [Dechloromonas denitrificans]
MTAAGKIVGVLLAAGLGRRFGSDKRLQPLADGTPLALAAARSLRAGCDEVLVVLRPGDAALAALLIAADCRVIYCAEAEQGMGHSLAAGVRASPAAAGWLIALADMPAIAPASHVAVAEALRRGASIAVPTFAGQRGHPVGFAARWRAELAAVQGDHGARQLLQGAPSEIEFVTLDDPGILADIDTPADLAAMPAVDWEKMAKITPRPA